MSPFLHDRMRVAPDEHAAADGDAAVGVPLRVDQAVVVDHHVVADPDLVRDGAARRSGRRRRCGRRRRAATGRASCAARARARRARSATAAARARSAAAPPSPGRPTTSAEYFSRADCPPANSWSCARGISVISGLYDSAGRMPTAWIDRSRERCRPRCVDPRRRRSAVFVFWPGVALRLRPGRHRADGEAPRRAPRLPGVHVRPDLHARRRGVARRAALGRRSARR